MNMTVDIELPKPTILTNTAISLVSPGPDQEKEEETEDINEIVKTESISYADFGSSRSLRNRRVSSTDSLHRINRRTIAKPKKVSPTSF
jgi:hypothetical protein